MVSEPQFKLFHCPRCKLHLPSFLPAGGVLIGLEFGVIVWELVEEDGDRQAIEDDSKSDANEGKHSTQDGLWVHVPVAHGGDAHLQGREEGSQSWRERKHKQETLKIHVIWLEPKLHLRRHSVEEEKYRVSMIMKRLNSSGCWFILFKLCETVHINLYNSTSSPQMTENIKHYLFSHLY